MILIVAEAIRGRCASIMILIATVSEIFGGQTYSTILVVLYRWNLYTKLILYKMVCFMGRQISSNFVVMPAYGS